jgi:hypothetical protein
MTKVAKKIGAPASTRASTRRPTAILPRDAAFAVLVPRSGANFGTVEQIWDANARSRRDFEDRAAMNGGANDMTPPPRPWPSGCGGGDTAK